ncbi:MAG: polysulfide reductase NrfD, partial [Thermomicrobiales bacterium]|nr:polysulfide reductase NrfD [Thermomicrobiales bacterium]
MGSWLVLAQTAPPSDTWFSFAPNWGWAIVLYFFFGGVAGGSAFLAAMLHLFGRPEDQPAVRRGYAIAVITLAVCAPLLIIDLTQPGRFWHMLFQSDAGGVM